jgi:peptide/nickel transport system substrate-binding protein
MRKRTLWSFFSLLVIISMLAACGGAEEATPAPEPTEKPVTEATEPAAPTDTPEPEAPPEPKILRVRLLDDILNLDPANIENFGDTRAVLLIYSGLVTYCPGTYEICNELVEWIEQSEDGLEISFKLKEGVMFTHGYGELTTEDVKYSYERYRDEELAVGYADDWIALDHVEIIDKYQGKIILSELYAPLWNSTLGYVSGLIVSKKRAEEVGPEGLAKDPVGSGPYYLDEWRPQEKVIFKRNPDFFGDAPYWDEIHLFPIVDDNTAEIALEAGELDFADISPQAIERFENDPDFRVVRTPTDWYMWIGMNVGHPKLQDVNVRRAIRAAIDVPSMLEVAWEGTVERTCSLIPPGMFFHWDDAPCYERDVEQAKAYMAAAGLESLDLRIDIDDSTEYRAIAEIAKENLKDIGINLEINPMDYGTYWDYLIGDSAAEIELFISEYGTTPDPAWVTMWFLCDQVDTWNLMRWCNEEFDELHKKGATTLDIEERKAIYLQMEQLFDEAAHTIWLTNLVSASAYSPDIVPVVYPTGGLMIRYTMPAE